MDVIIDKLTPMQIQMLSAEFGKSPKKITQALVKQKKEVDPKKIFEKQKRDSKSSIRSSKKNKDSIEKK